MNMLQEKAAKLFCNELASEATNSHNRTAWVKAVTYLATQGIDIKPLICVKEK